MDLPQIVDVHAHLDAPQFERDLDAVLERARRTGVRHILSVGTDVASSQRCAALAERRPGLLHPTAGIHPAAWPDAGPDDMDRIERLAAGRNFVAVGETGLDFHYDAPPPAEQIRLFERHVALALSVGKPIIVHARRADDEVLDVLRAAGDALRGVRHCFDRPMDVAERYIELDFHISIGAAVTREGYRKFKAAARAIPADRLLLETDCPYQAPASRAGGRNEPAFIVETLVALAGLRGVSPDELAAATTANARRLFGLPQACGATPRSERRP